ncbi:MAG: amidase family protein [Rhodobacteraceae bacterium]|nr:amidase family protein [Paracoccaceae bacterium]
MTTELWRLTAAEQAKLVRTGAVSAMETAQSAFTRLEAVNPALNAVVEETREQALSTARAVDAKRAAGEEPGPLAGVPVTIKVNVDQAGCTNTNGLRLQKDLIAQTDSPVVANLRAAGAVIVGRTNTPAFSLRWFCRNSLHGATKNPHNAALTPGGSSGGAGAAVAAGLCAIGHGTDIAGSIRYPAYACGVHGLRPSLGRVPAVNFSGPDRHIGAQLMAVSGPIARSIEDLRLGLEAMGRPDPRDPWSAPAPLDLPPRPKRVALTIAPDGLEIAPEVEAALRDAARRLEAEGWRVEEVDCPPLEEPAQLQAVLWMADTRMGVDEAAAREGDPDALFILEQMFALSPEVDMPSLMHALQRRATLTRAWRLFLADYPLLLCPVSAEPPFPDQLDVQSPEAFRRVMRAQLTQIGLPLMGLPGLAVTTSVNSATPIGVQLVADRFREDLLLDAGAAIERQASPIEPVEPAA